MPDEVVGNSKGSLFVVLEEWHSLDFSMVHLVLREMQGLIACANVAGGNSEKSFGSDVSDCPARGKAHRKTGFIRAPEE
jgi:hypothetical protein